MLGQRGTVNLILIIGIVAVIAIPGFFLLQKRTGTNPTTTLTSQTAGSPAPATSDWDRYKETTIDQIILEENDFAVTPEMIPEEFKTDSVYNYNARGLHNPYKVRLIYKNQYRKISPKMMEFLRNWAKSLRGVPLNNNTTNTEELIKLFESETLLVEGNKEYWMPIQNQLIPYLKEEVKLNEQVDVFIMFSGTYLESGKFNWVFIINEFQTQRG